jgi:excisionase family DNA binding protein
MRPFRKPQLKSQTLNIPDSTGQADQASKTTHGQTKPVPPSVPTDPTPAEILTGSLQQGIVCEKKEEFDQKSIADRAMKKSRPHKYWHASVGSGQRDVLTEQDVAELLDCEKSTVQKKARNGDLPGVKFGRSWVFPKTALLQSLHADAMRNRSPVRLPNGHAHGFAFVSSRPQQQRRGTPPALPPL